MYINNNFEGQSNQVADLTVTAVENTVENKKNVFSGEMTYTKGFLEEFGKWKAEQDKMDRAIDFCKEVRENCDSLADFFDEVEDYCDDKDFDAFRVMKALDEKEVFPDEDIWYYGYYDTYIAYEKEDCWIYYADGTMDYFETLYEETDNWSDFFTKAEEYCKENDIDVEDVLEKTNLGRDKDETNLAEKYND